MEEITAFENQKILDVGIEKEVKQSFIEYAMSVIVSRALPDVRDGLKPVHRRILYAMYEDNLTYDKSYRKSATTVGNVLGRYHPHGDTAVYDSMVRLAQPFSMRYPLIDGQGNFGNIDGDGAAAYRYTEARLARFANEMMTSIEKEVVNFSPNFDNKLQEPDVLPASFPNLLVNGSVGIAVGMATNIPPHNLGEVIDGTIHLLENPDATIPDLMNFIKGPDFPTYATICGMSGIQSTYMTGHGRIIVRSKAEVDEEKHRIIVTEIPYQVNKQMLVESMADCVKTKKIEGITGINDATGQAGIKIVIDYRRDANGQVILNQLYKYTQLQDTFAANMLALVDGEPKILNLKQILQRYIMHREEVTVRRVQFDLKKARHDAHINEGYKIAIDNIEAVIAIIRGSASISDAKVQLMESFGLTEIQAQAIVEMTLGRLSGMERQKIEDRLAKLHATIEELEGILASEGKIKEIIKTELLEIKDRYSDPRRTEIVPVHDEIIYEDLIDRHTCVLTMTRDGYIKRQPSDTYTAQKRGGKGIIGMGTKEEDLVENVLAMNSHALLMMFTNRGRVHTRKAYLIPEAGRTAKGTNIVNILDLEQGEKITAMLPVNSFAQEEYLFMVTRFGIVKRTPLYEFEYQRKGGKIAISLDEGDELVFVRRATDEDEIMIATRGGLAVRFRVGDVRPMGRSARGVIGIRLEEGDEVAGATIVDNEKTLLTICEGGYGKRCEFNEYSAHSRGTKGVCCHRISDKTGLLAGIAAVNESDDIMMITDEGTIIRTPAAGIPVYGRTAGGVIVMRLAEGSSIVNFSRIESEEEQEKEIEAASQAQVDVGDDAEDMDIDADTDAVEISGEDDDI
ncbi:MAG: DNA gyrase subunit A [Clostridia bacterium]|nr:DNA gyrase subunit A [Clostridia bacterium]MBQ4575856.1 DNA gyrase subunit A [Clostridia bacterium]